MVFVFCVCFVSYGLVEHVGQLAPAGDELHADIAEDDDDDHVQDGHGDTALEHLLCIQTIAHGDGTDADGQEEFCVVSEGADEPVGTRVQTHLAGECEDDGASDCCCSGAVGDFREQTGEDDQHDDGGQTAVMTF